MREKVIEASTLVVAALVLYVMIASAFGWIVGSIAWVVFLLVAFLRMR